MIKKLKDGVYLKEKNNDFKIIYPYKKDLEKPFTKDNIHWKNLFIGGSWSKFFMFLLVLFLILFLAYAYKHDTQECFNFLENKTLRCQNCIEGYQPYNLELEGIELNDLNLSFLP